METPICRSFSIFLASEGGVPLEGRPLLDLVLQDGIIFSFCSWVSPTVENWLVISVSGFTAICGAGMIS